MDDDPESKLSALEDRHGAASAKSDADTGAVEQVEEQPEDTGTDSEVEEPEPEPDEEVDSSTSTATESESAEETEEDAEADADSDSSGDGEVSWEPLTLYLTEDVHQEFNKPFFMRMQLEHPELQDFMKRELQQAAVEESLDRMQEVADRAQDVHDRLVDDFGEPDEADWEPLTLYLTEDVHQEFNKPFFMRMQLEYPELQDFMKRELQQAAVLDALDRMQEVAERAHEVHDRVNE